MVHNILPPSQLREEARVQEEVQNRLRHLADNIESGMGKIKSQRGGAVDVFVNHKVRWSHEFVLSGQNKDRVTYNQLSPVQWMPGFCRTMQEESDITIREYMLDYVIDLLDDATDFSWSSAKASHAVLLCRMEQGEIKSWLDTDKIERVRHAHDQRHNAAQNNAQRGQEKHPSVKTITCVYYNKGVCSQKQTHETKVVLYKHVCASCWSKYGKAYPHPQTECCKSTKNQLDLGMTWGLSHVHKARTVVNSSFLTKSCCLYRVGLSTRLVGGLNLPSPVSGTGIIEHMPKSYRASLTVPIKGCNIMLFNTEFQRWTLLHPNRRC